MKKIIILYFLGALLLSGCMRDEFDTTRVEEGIAARVSLRMLLPDMDGAVSAGNTRTSARIGWTACAYWYSTATAR